MRLNPLVPNSNRELHAELQAILDAVVEAVRGLDAQGSVTFCNHALLKITGYQWKKWSARTCTNCYITAGVKEAGIHRRSARSAKPCLPNKQLTLRESSSGARMEAAFPPSTGRERKRRTNGPV